MDNHKIVSPSELIQSTLPQWIRSQEQPIVDGSSVAFEGRSAAFRERYRSENHRNFINFMEKSAEAQERIGFSQDLLQNLLKYRDFDTYAKDIVQFNYLKLEEGEVLSADEEESLELVDGYGFPETNGIISIDDEIIYYRRREGNTLLNLQRGASGTTMLSTFRRVGEYKSTLPQDHLRGSEVVNLSVLFLVSMLDTIHKTYASNIDASRVVPEVNRSSLLQNIKDFFRAKGTKLGIKALFKFLFAEPDVDVFYPGDRMIKPSSSTWYEGRILRTVPVPLPFLDPEEKHIKTDKIISSSIKLKSYLDDGVYGEGVCEYVSEYQYEGDAQYELSLNRDNIDGNFISNPNTHLTRPLSSDATNTPFRDYNTVTVGSTLGFPPKGVIFIDQEAIYYTRKTSNQFLDCTRGYIGVCVSHNIQANVYGPYYIEASMEVDGEIYTNRSWPKGLVESINIPDSGLLNVSDDRVTIGLPGMLDPREQILCTIKKEDVFDVFGHDDTLVGLNKNTAVRISGRDPYIIYDGTTFSENVTYTFTENYDDLLVSQDPIAIADGRLKLMADRTFGVDSVYFSPDHVFVSSSGFPSYTFGDFNQDDQCIVGRELSDENILALIPRRHEIKENNYFDYKGSDQIGIATDGVRIFSNVSPNVIISGTIGSFDIIESGRDYKTPTLLVEGEPGLGEIELDNGRIVNVKVVGTGEYDYNPTCEVVSGIGGQILATFDRFGRVTRAAVANGGKYYYDEPIVQAVDATGKGKGCLLKCRIADGLIQAVEIINPGIDYDSKATQIIIKPIGTGGQVRANTQYYEINRPGEILYSPCNYKFDEGNGFLYEKPGTVNNKTTFGYTVMPSNLVDMELEGIEHSKLIGWAFDGNPIYGPYGFKNNEDIANGVERQESGYVQITSRRAIKPAKSDVIGTNPPQTSEYALGYFVQDFVYNPDALYPQDSRPGYLANEIPELLDTEMDLHIEIETGERYIDVYPNRLLDENNGKVCNTPEFPKELYPDGVYCYFTTIDENDEPQFPYFVGKTFNNRPISQVIDDKTIEEIEPINRSIDYSSTKVEEAPIVFDVESLERLRTPVKESNRQNIKLEISSLTEGYINDIIIQNANTPNRCVGDFLYIDNTGTSGAGAQAIVKSIKGQKVMSARGSTISYNVIPHIHVIDLLNNVINNTAINFTLNQDYTTNSIGENLSEVRVIRYMQNSAQLVVETTSESVPQQGDFIFDQKGRKVIFGEVSNLRTPIDHDVLWFDNTANLSVNDVLHLDSEEKIEILRINNNNSVIVARGIDSEPRFIEDGFKAKNDNKFFYEMRTQSEHGLTTGDTITIEDAFVDINGTHKIEVMTTTSFKIYTKTLIPDTINFTYTTDSLSVRGFVGSVELTSPGYGYSSLPYVRGIYNRFIDKSVVKPVMSGTSISSFEVESGGDRYNDNAEVVIVDLQGGGSGASAEVRIEGGKVIGVNVINGGVDYIEPIVHIIQPEGKYLLSTDNIGKITSMKIINPGRDVNVEGLGRPEIITPTRVVVKYKDDRNRFQIGEEVFQGCQTLITAAGFVVDYDHDRQILTLADVTGFISDEELIFNKTGVGAYVVNEGDSHLMTKVKSVSSPLGRFVDDKSLISESYAVIQDSYRYQWFSYVISSDIRTSEYDTFVEKIIHPAGFVRFGDLTLRSGIKSPFNTDTIDSGLEIGRLTDCDSIVLIVGQDTDDPILISDENGNEDYLLVYPKLCGGVIPMTTNK